MWPEYQSKTFCELVAYERTPELRVSGNIILSTKYGDPSNQIYPDSNLSLKQPQRIYNLDAAFGNDKDILCFAQPNLIASSDGYRGPSDQWWDRGGFYQQSNAQSNFPTSGFDSAFFYLRTAGIDARKLKFNPSSFTQGSVSVNIEIVTRDSIKVTLNGPNFQNPSPFVSPGQIVIKDIDNRINYPFELKNWFIANPNSIENYAKAESYCNGLTGYHLPKRWDLTNNDSIKFSNCSGSGNDASTPGQQCTAGHYIRKLNDGSLLAEWGSLANGYYPDSQWVNTDYWTSDSFSYAGTYRYVVHPSGGRILIFRESDDRDVRVTCVND